MGTCTISDMTRHIARAEPPLLGVEDYLNFDWMDFSHAGQHDFVPPAERADAQVALATKLAEDRVGREELRKLSDGIAELSDTIRELQKERREQSPRGRIALVAETLAALASQPVAQPVVMESQPVAVQPTMSDKKRARMARNRMSAQESRERKKRHTQNLENRVKELESETARYKANVEQLHLVVKTLSKQIEELKSSSS